MSWVRPIGKHRIKKLKAQDAIWLEMLSRGVMVKHLPGMRSEQAIKNRLMKIRWCMKVKTTVEAVAEALRRGIIK